MGRSAEEIKKDIESGNTALGIEFGSTRIKAVLTDGTTAPIAQGAMSGKTVWKMVSGPIPWKISGKA